MKSNVWFLKYFQIVILVLIPGEKLVGADQQFEGSSIPCYDAAKKVQVIMRESVSGERIPYHASCNRLRGSLRIPLSISSALD